MQRVIIRRFFTSLLAIFGATIIVFSASRLLADPRMLLIPQEAYGINQEQWDKMLADLKLDRHIVVQYGYWVYDILRGDLGVDLADRNPIAPKLVQKIGPTLRLGIAAWLLATIIGIPLGVLSAVKRGSFWDYLGRGFALFGQALPMFWVAIVGIFVFSVQLGWLPPATMGEGFSIRYYILPTCTIAWYVAAGYVRLERSAMLEILDAEYIKMARAKGVGEWMVIWKHALKNAILAPLTYAGLLLAGVIHGSVMIETVFAWPGLARYAVQAVWTNNFTVLAVITLIFTVIYVVANFATDILYAFLDPRIRYS